MINFEPKIIGFLCNYCSYEGADSAGRAQKEYPANIKIVRVMCAGSVDPEFIIEAYKEGADGVLVLGCHPGDCHNKEGNIFALRRHVFLRNILNKFDIQPERLRLEWVSANEADRFVKIVSDMVNDLKKIGPLAFLKKD